MRTRPIHLLRTMPAAIIAAVLLVVLSATAGAALPSPVVGWTDDFGSSILDARWSWVREDSTHWNLTERPGFLRIKTQEGTIYQGTNNTKNLLLQAAPAGDFEVQTRVLFVPTENIQAAGLIAYQDGDNYLALIRGFCGFGPPCAGNAIYFDHEEEGQTIGGNFATAVVETSEAYLRIKRDQDVYTGYYSTNGNDWILIGAHVATHGLLPRDVGLMASNSEFAAAEITADFDFFSLNAQPHRILLPLVVKEAARPATAYHLVPDSATCVPNAGVSYYQGMVRDRAGELQNAVCVHVAFFGPRNTKCSGCDGVGDGNWGFAPFGGPAPANIPVEIFIVPCPPYLPPGGQSSDFGDLTPLSDKWLLTTSSTSMQCTGITFMQN